MESLKIAFYTLGCKVNQYETEAVTELFQQQGCQVVPFEEVADIYIINTCTVTSLSDRKSRQIIRRARKNNPNGIVAVTGCYAQVSKEEILSIPGVDIVTGTKDRSKILQLVVEKMEKFTEKIQHVEDIFLTRDFENLRVSSFNDRTRAYVKIQDGCVQFCTYCIIPYARGPLRSKPLKDIYEEVSGLAKAGYLEIVLTGIHLASYGKDSGSNLIEVFKMIYNIEGIERIRLGSLEPNVVTEEFVRFIREHKKICNQFHLSLQSGSDGTLKIMNRKYNSEEYRNSVKLIYKELPDAAITTDMMVGFPEESWSEFEESYQFAKEMAFSKIHVFKYSPRKGTKAFEMKNQVPAEIKEERSNRLLQLSDELQMKFHQKFLGRSMKVLMEEGNIGFTDNYIKVRTKNYYGPKGALEEVLLVKAQIEYMEGEISN